MNVNIKLLHPEAKLPVKSHSTDACFDCYAVSKEYIGNLRYEYGLGFSLELPEGTQLDLRSRSSIHKTGLMLSNGIGTGDEGYTGEYKVVFYHVIPGMPPYEIGDRVCQIQLSKRTDMEFEIVNELQETERSDGGYGSTGN